MNNLERLIVENEKEQHELFQKLKEIRDRRICLAKEHLKLRRQLLKEQLSYAHPDGYRIYLAKHTNKYDIASWRVRVFKPQEKNIAEWFSRYFSLMDTNINTPLGKIEVTEESIEELYEWQINMLLEQLEDQHE